MILITVLIRQEYMTICIILLLTDTAVHNHYTPTLLASNRSFPVPNITFGYPWEPSVL